MLSYREETLVAAVVMVFLLEIAASHPAAAKTGMSLPISDWSNCLA